MNGKKKSVFQISHPSTLKGGPHPHERFQRDGTKDKLSLSSVIHNNDSRFGVDPFVCECQCHRTEAGLQMPHCMACCEVSPCGLNIKSGLMQSHLNCCEHCRSIGEQAEL